MNLYIYDHCPFCVRAQMIFGLKNIPVIIHHLANDDEETPISFTGKKMLPILDSDSMYMRESMDIVHYVDLTVAPSIVRPPMNSFIYQWLAGARKVVYALFVPRCTHYPFPEFSTESSRIYFKDKKEQLFGRFDDLMAQTDDLIEKLNPLLTVLDNEIKLDDVQANLFSEDDFHLFPTLRCLTLIPEVHLPSKIALYLSMMSEKTGIPLMDSRQLCLP